MIITDEKKMYTLNFDEKRRVMKEVNTGVWSKDDFKRFEQAYKSIGNILSAKPWAKLCDLRTYKVSGINEELAAYTEWMANNNLAAATIVDSAVTQMQMNKAVEGKFKMKAFLSESEADEWLKSLGF